MAAGWPTVVRRCRKGRSHQSPVTSHQPPMTLRRLFPVGCGRHGGAPGPSPGEADRNTVSTKTERSAQTVFRKLASGGRVRALPQRLRRAGRATSRGLGIPPALHPGRRALRGPPIAVRLPRLAPADPRSIRSRRRFGSPAERASLATGPGESPTGPSYGGLGTLPFLEDERNRGVVGAGYADNRRIVSRAASVRGPPREQEGTGRGPPSAIRHPLRMWRRVPR